MFLALIASLSALASAPPSPISNHVSGVDKYSITLKAVENHQPVPIEIVNDLILFRVSVAGRTVWATIDNGAARTLADKSLISSIGDETIVQPGVAHTPGGDISREIASSVPITVPGQFSTVAEVAVADLSHLSEKLGRNVGLLIGHDILSIAAVVVIPQKQQLGFQPGGRPVSSAPPGTRLVTLPIYEKGLMDQVSVMIDGKQSNLTIDSGSDMPLTLNQSVWNRVKKNDSVITTGKQASLGGEKEVIKSTIPDVDLGGYHVHDIKTVISNFSPEYGDGTLGAGLLERFSFILDLKGQKLVIAVPLPISPIAQ